MRIDITNNNASFIGMVLSFTPRDIDRLIANLRDLKVDQEQHFHISSTTDDRYIDLEIGIQFDSDDTNAQMSGFAIDPNDAVLPGEGDS